MAKSQNPVSSRQMPIAQKNRKDFFVNNQLFLIKTGIKILVFLLVSLIISRLVYPFDIGHLEAFSWMPAAHLLEGKNPYSFAFTPPYSMSPYGVVFYALLAVGIKIFGLQLWWGRLLSVLGFAVCVWAVAKITKKLTENNEAAWAAALAALTLFSFQSWIAIMRSDLAALAFACAALGLVFLREMDKPFGAARLTAVVLLSVVAFFTKHTFLLPVGIIVLRFLQLKKWRESIFFGAGFLVLTAAGMFILNYTSDGGYIWQHFIHAQDLPFAFERLTASVFTMTTAPTSIVFGVFLLIFVYGKREFFFRKKREEWLKILESPESLIWFYLFLSFTAAALSAGRIGASINYYLETSFVIALAVGLIYDDFRKQSRLKLAAAMIVLFFLGGVFQLVRFGRGEYFRWQAASYYREISETAARLAPAGNVCMSVYVELVTRGGCAFYFDDYGEYMGDWSPELNAVFDKEVRAGRFAVIVWKKNNFQEKYPNYELIPMSQNAPERYFPVYLYVRKGENSR